MRIALTIASPLLLLAAAAAQDPFRGNGLGQAFLGHTMLRIGSTVSLSFGSPAAPGGLAVLGVSDSLSPTQHPITGMTGLDLTSPALQLLFFALDGSGNASYSAPIANVPALAGMTPLFGLVAVFEPTVVSLTRSTRFAWENADSYSLGGALQLARAGHTATYLGAGPTSNESRVLVVGGGGGSLLVPQATRSTELYSTLLRHALPGPNLLFERALHQAVRLPDGRVIVCGGLDSAGVVTATVERFDPATGGFTQIASMLHPRAGHCATLLGNGKVLVTGGLANYVNPLQNLAAVLNTAQNTGELFDPATGAWTAVPGTMASPRSGHVHTLLGNGNVLVSGGIQGGVTIPQGYDLPLYTATCNVYDPVANAWSTTGTMQLGRAFHGASVLANGDVLVTGGSVLNAAFALVGATDSCERWNGATWSVVGRLQTPATNHVQFTGPNGDAVVVGGLTGIFPVLGGTATAGHHDGVLFTAGRNVGENPGLPAAVASLQGAMTATRIFDGSWLLLGGTDGATPLASALVFLP